jgi:HTH-type transcriptional regulator/antitoxin MqsA
MKKCPFCKDGFLERKTINEIYTYQGHTLKVKQPGEWCNMCEEGILNGADLKATERQKNDFQSQVDGLLTSSDIRKIRLKLKLTEKQTVELCGGNPYTFTSYERGEATPIRSTSNLLRLLNNHPQLLNELIAC